MPKHAKEKFKVWGDVFDEFTSRTIFKLISQGHFIGLESPVSIGKEANIFSAVTKDGSRVMVKIYRLETCDFNKMYQYIKQDPRYAGLNGKKRKIILAWVQREFRNLHKARLANVRVPTPLAYCNNVLVLEFIGKGNFISPRLTHQKPKNPKAFLEAIVKNLKLLYKAGLVHADLSGFNILNHNEEPVFIDFSQTTSLKDYQADTYLKRDITNICTFFRKLGVKAVEEKIMKEIKG